jgi:mono/diheme cytochrome c family protein
MRRATAGRHAGRLDLSGGLIPVRELVCALAQRPARSRRRRTGDPGDIVALLKTGIAPRGSTMGPMAEVVFRSTQHLSDADLTAMAVYLKPCPAQARAPEAARKRRDAGHDAERGAKIYDQYCAYCHGEQGQGGPAPTRRWPATAR